MSPPPPQNGFSVPSKLFTAPCNLLIFPCWEVCTALFIARGLAWQLYKSIWNASVQCLTSARVVRTNGFYRSTVFENTFRSGFLMGAEQAKVKDFIISNTSSSTIWLLTQTRIIGAGWNKVCIGFQP